MDNDCDTRVDEGIPVGAPCGSSVGECRPGVNVCNPMTGGFDCSGRHRPGVRGLRQRSTTTATCMTDEGLGLGGPCGTAEGLCMPGTERCVARSPRLRGRGRPERARPATATDNDCDGSDRRGADDRRPLPAGLHLLRLPVCAALRGDSEFGFECPTGKTPRGSRDGMCFCVADACDDAACGTETVRARRRGAVRDPTRTDVANCVCRNNECTFSLRRRRVHGRHGLQPARPARPLRGQRLHRVWAVTMGEICNVMSAASARSTPARR